MPRPHRRLLALLLTLGLTTSGSLRAGGGEESGGDVEAEGPSYFGFAWDTRGATLAGTRVVLKAKNGKSAEFRTNVLGLYRGHIAKDVKPDDVEMICERPGYRMIKFQRRTHSGTSPTNLEFDCTLQRL